MPEEPEKLVVELTIPPDSPFHKSVGTMSLIDFLGEHGLGVNMEPCDGCEIPCEDEEREPRFDPNDLD